MQSYFFVPATKISKVESLLDSGVDQIIVDFEDAIKVSQRELLLKEVEAYPRAKDFFIRIPLFNVHTGAIDLAFIDSFIGKGFTKLVLPKLSSIDEIDLILGRFQKGQLEIIVLIETPGLYLELQGHLKEYKEQFHGIALGSHDFMAFIGGKHNLKNLETVRQNILYMARALGVLAIDIASMDLANRKGFELELLDGFDKGYDAKFLIHPSQLDIFNSTKFYSKEEYLNALQIVSGLRDQGNKNEFSPTIINGKIVERPHIERAIKILKSYKKHE